MTTADTGGIIILKNMLDNATTCTLRAEKFKAKGDVAATLLNYLLAYNAYDISISSFNEFSACISEDWCLDIRETFTKRKREVAAQIDSLQQILKKQLTNAGRGGGGGEDDDEVDCNIAKPLRGSSISFNDVIGMDSVKSELCNHFIFPMLYTNMYPSLAKGILMYGLPGVGKTFIIKAAINELQSEGLRVIFYAPTGAELKGKYVGETEKKISAFFECASKKARECEKDTKTKFLSVLFIDEIEAIGGDRMKDQSGLMTNSVNLLLQKMDGIMSLDNVVVIAATNFPWKLDAALLRRFTAEIYIPLPTKTDIFQLIKKQLGNYLKIDKLPINVKKVEKIPDIDEFDACNIKKFEDIDKKRETFPQVWDMLQLRGTDIFDIATYLSKKSYSNSDVVRYINSVISQAANAARRYGLFEKVSYKQNFAFMSMLSSNELFDKKGDKISLVDFDLDSILEYNGKEYKSIHVQETINSDLVSPVVDVYVSEDYLKLEKKQRLALQQVGNWWGKLTKMENPAYGKFIVVWKMPLKIKYNIEYDIEIIGVTQLDYETLKEPFKLSNNFISKETQHNFFYRLLTTPPQNEKIFHKNKREANINTIDHWKYLFKLVLQRYMCQVSQSKSPDLYIDLNETPEECNVKTGKTEIKISQVLNPLWPDIPRPQSKDAKIGTFLGLRKHTGSKLKLKNTKKTENLKHIKTYSAENQLKLHEIQNSLKTASISMSFFEHAKKSSKQTIRQSDLELVEKYADAPGEFDLKKIQQ